MSYPVQPYEFIIFAGQKLSEPCSYYGGVVSMRPGLLWQDLYIIQDIACTSFTAEKKINSVFQKYRGTLGKKSAS